MAYHVDDIRTVALVGHEAAGKTSLADALLFKAKATERRGSPDDGSSVSDFDEEEKKHKYSIDSAVLHLDTQGKRVYLIDTPGKPDFVGQALGGLNPVDTAIVVISASSGVQVNTRRMFNEAGKRKLARMIVINKLDAENIHFDDLLNNIRATFGKACVLLNAPLNVGPGFSGVVSVLTPPASPPAGCAVDLAKERSLLVDCIVEADEVLMEKYLGEGDLSADELTAAFPKALAAGTVIPILCTCVKKDKDIGVAEVLEAILKDAPSPKAAVKRVGTKGTGDKATQVEIEPTETGEFVGQVFKTISDKFVGTLSYFRVLSGKLTPEQPIITLRTGRGGRSSGLLLPQGKTTKPMTEAVPGDIIAVAKVEDLHIGDTVALNTNAPKLPLPHYPTPMFGLAVEPKARGDEQKISGSLTKIADEDPTFKVTRDTQTKELVITGNSQVHLDIVQKRLKARYDLEILTHEPKIAYRETLTATSDAEYQHKKQSGGRGQYGKVHFRVYPLKDLHIKSEAELLEKFANKSRFEKMRSAHYDPEYNFAFIDHIVGGTVPNNFIPAVEKGCKEVLDQGALAGYRMQDVAVELYFGKYHDVDSSEAAFKTAARMCFKKAFREARPVLLEPIVHLEVTLPTKYTGDILKDLNGKRARVEDQDSLPGDLAVIKAIAPLAEMTRYAAQLGSITQGQGSYTMEFSRPGQRAAADRQQGEAGRRRGGVTPV
ncbi:MAG: elongation factor G [Planctomycetes bacterium]|nr:elongation factor G [Planctomycetota bacterium]